MVQKCNVSDKSYLPAPKEIQDKIKSMYVEYLESVYGKIPIQDIYKDFANTSKIVGFKGEAGNCFQTSIIEIAENGGELVFGSLGFKKLKGKGYFYEFGGKNYTIGQFLVW
jgi:hypothetical protein